MDILAFLILAVVILAVMWGLVKLVLIVLVGAIIYLCAVAITDKIKEWLK